VAAAAEDKDKKHLAAWDLISLSNSHGMVDFFA